MTRVAVKMKLFKGQEAEYRRRHDAIWPELKELLKGSGISEYSIFFDEASGFLFSILKVAEPKKLEDIPKMEVMKRWWKYMADIMETNEDYSPVASPLQEVFYLP